MRALSVTARLLSLFVLAGCSQATGGGATTSEDDLASISAKLCNVPVVSATGRYVALDECAKGAAPGRIVRVDVETGARQVLATYPATDRAIQLKERGDRLYFAVLHQPDELDQATAGLDVHVYAWESGEGRIITPALPAEVTGSFRGLQHLSVTDDGGYVAFSPLGEDALARRLFVAPTTGTDAPVSFDPGERLWWFVKGGSILGYNGQRMVGEPLAVRVIETGVEGIAMMGARIEPPAEIRLSLESHGDGRYSQTPSFDGRTLVGVRTAEDGTARLVRYDPASGAEAELDTGLALTVLESPGPDVLYEKIEQTGSSYTMTLVRQPRAGGDANTLLTASASSQDELGTFEIVSVREGSPFAVAAKEAPGEEQGPLTRRRFVVALDGSVAPQELPSDMLRSAEGGDLLLYRQQLSGGASPSYAWNMLDLSNGAWTELPYVATRSPGIADDGTVFVTDACQTSAGKPGARLRRVNAASVEERPCDPAFRADWSFARIPNSDAALYVSDLGDGPIRAAIVR